MLTGKEGVVVAQLRRDIKGDGDRVVGQRLDGGDAQRVKDGMLPPWRRIDDSHRSSALK